MSCKMTHAIEFALPHDNATRVDAVVTFAAQDADLPYFRQEAKARIHSSIGCKIPLASFVSMCGKSWRVIETTRRSNGWATLKIAHMAPIGVGSWSGNVVVCEPCVFPGTEARTEDIDRFRTDVVIAMQRPTRDTYEAVRETTQQLVAYMEHSAAAQLRQGWSLFDGTRRFRIDSVGDLDKLSVLPFAKVTQTGFA